mmetsp:Transcript_5267/g.7777  ORF Transcript_5267/g.7777 Transcript_5267/m.7777 type:complete len:203 (+) Transcript_5267:217-825(+)
MKEPHFSRSSFDNQTKLHGMKEYWDENELDEFILNGRKKDEFKLLKWINVCDCPTEVNLKKTKAFYLSMPRIKDDDWYDIKFKLMIDGKVFFNIKSIDHLYKIHSVDQTKDTIKFWIKNECLKNLFDSKKKYKNYKKLKIDISIILSTLLLEKKKSMTSSIVFSHKSKKQQADPPPKKKTPVNSNIVTSLKFPILDNENLSF